jgi:hypothetical protein
MQVDRASNAPIVEFASKNYETRVLLNWTQNELAELPAVSRPTPFRPQRWKSSC